MAKGFISYDIGNQNKKIDENANQIHEIVTIIQCKTSSNKYLEDQRANQPKCL